SPRPRCVFGAILFGDRPFTKEGFVSLPIDAHGFPSVVVLVYGYEERKQTRSKQEREETKTYLKILDVYRVYRVDTGRCVDSIHPNPRNERSLSGIYSGALPLQSAPSAAIVGGPFACRCG